MDATPPPSPTDKLKEQLRASVLSAIGASRSQPPLTQDDKDRESDRELKKFYAKGLLWILSVELAVMNLVFIAVGISCLHFEDWTLRLFMSGTLAQVFGVVVVVTRHLFPKK